MRVSINLRPPDGESIDDTDKVSFDKKEWRTLVFVLTLLGVTILMIFALA